MHLHLGERQNCRTSFCSNGIQEPAFGISETDTEQHSPTALTMAAHEREDQHQWGHDTSDGSFFDERKSRRKTNEIMQQKPQSKYAYNQRRHVVLILCSLLVLFTGMTSNALASPSASIPPSTSEIKAAGSWWDGENFDDSVEIDSGSSSTNPQLSFSSGPLIQVPCGLIVTGSLSFDASKTDNSKGEEVLPLSTMIDTSLTTSTIQSSVLERYPQLQALVRRRSHDDDASTIETDKQTTPFYIPAGFIKLRLGSEEATAEAPVLLVDHDEDGDRGKNAAQQSAVDRNFELRLGLDFLRSHGVVLDLEVESMRLHISPLQDSKEEREDTVTVSVPFIRPRPTLDFGDMEEL